ncbi:TonB-dependent receptor [Rhodoplanes roseus]|nr:TonB-dependent receptor [Rhodoplanes roseus]
MTCLDTRKGRAALAVGLTVLLGTAAQAQSTDTTTLPDLYVTATRLGGGAGGALGITGASTTVITSEEIERSPEQTIPGILAREPGVQVSNLYGGVNGARATVDIRGFGATGAQNTLVLIDGRRVDLPDLQTFDWGSVPLNSVERIEVTRGNSGGVLYGDGAVGGVINIVTKKGTGRPNGAKAEVAYGSFNQVEGRGTAFASSGPHALAVYANAVRSDGYRDNSQYHQMNAGGDYRYTRDWGSFYFNTTASDQVLGLPGGRRVDPTLGLNQLATDRRGTNTPWDYANQQQASATTGVTYDLLPGAELIVDGGVRVRKQQAAYFPNCLDTFTGVFNTSCQKQIGTAYDTSYFKSSLVTSSVTPRLKVDTTVFGLPLKSLTGVDFYHTDYASPRALFDGAAPIHQYDLDQSSLAAYTMNTVTLFSNTDVSAGGRVQRTSLSARDAVNTGAPGYLDPWGFPTAVQATPLDDTQTNHAWHLGIEHRFNQYLTFFGRAAQSFRVPNVDERIGSAPYGIPSNFGLKTQTSRDLEGGVKVTAGPMFLQWSIYDMYLENEIFYSPYTTTNVNLDPTRRYGSEALATVQVSETVRLKGSVAYTRAVFREGVYAGNDVPLVSRNTAGVGVVWNIVDTRLVFSGDVRFVGSRRMDNDQRNVQPMTPNYSILDAKIGGEWQRYFWSVAVQNILNADYFDYAIASPYPDGFGSKLGVYNAYPQPGRTFLLRVGANF